MNNAEHRLYPQHKTEIGVTVHNKGEKISATLIDVGHSNIGLSTEKGISPGTAVDIMMNLTDDYIIHGTVEWVLLNNRGGNFQYRIGIETDQVLAPEDIWKNVFPETSPKSQK